MPISFQCQNCGKKFSVNDNLAGKAAKCKCGARVTVPHPAAAADDLFADDPFGGDLSSFENAAPAANLPPVQPTPQQPAQQNPYSPPATQSYASVSDGAITCPNCGDTANSKVHWTWWGGLIGPLIINTVACNSCNTHYNGKTGNYNTVAISIYFGIFATLGLILTICSILGAANR